MALAQVVLQHVHVQQYHVIQVIIKTEQLAQFAQQGIIVQAEQLLKLHVQREHIKIQQGNHHVRHVLLVVQAQQHKPLVRHIAVLQYQMVIAYKHQQHVHVQM